MQQKDNYFSRVILLSSGTNIKLCVRVTVNRKCQTNGVCVCVCVCVCQKKTENRADGMSEKSAHSPGRDLNLCLWDTRPSCFRLYREGRHASRQSKQTLQTLTHQLHRETPACITKHSNSYLARARVCVCVCVCVSQWKESVSVRVWICVTCHALKPCLQLSCLLLSPLPPVGRELVLLLHHAPTFFHIFSFLSWVWCSLFGWHDLAPGTSKHAVRREEGGREVVWSGQERAAVVKGRDGGDVEKNRVGHGEMESADVRLRTEGVLQSFGKALHCDLQSFTRRTVRLAERCHQIVGHVVLLLPRRLVEGVASPFHAVLLWSILKGENAAALHSIHNDGGTHRHELTTADLRSKCAPTTVYLKQRQKNLRDPCLSGRWTGGVESLHSTWSEDPCKILHVLFFFSPSSQLKKETRLATPLQHCTVIDHDREPRYTRRALVSTYTVLVL